MQKLALYLAATNARIRAAIPTRYDTGISMSVFDVDAFDDHAVPRWEDSENLASLPPVPACDHHDLIVFSNTKCDRHDYKTSGANEIIFMNFFSLSSRATGPKTRVPIGSP